MKHLLTPLLALAAAAFFVPQTADARGCNSNHNRTYVSGHSSCGCPIYTKRVLKAYDCQGHPIYSYCRQPVVHRCRKSHGHHHHSSHGHKSYTSAPPRRQSYSVSYRSSSRSCSGRSYRTSYTRRW